MSGEVLPPADAVITTLPAETPVATPVLAPIVAMAVSADNQVDVVVTFDVVESESVAVAVRLMEAPTPTLGVAGVMATDIITGAVTFRVAVLEVLPLNEAVIELVPVFIPVAMPLLLRVATLVSLEFQLTEPEILRVVLSE